MKNLHLNQITASIQKLVSLFPKFTFYLFGSMARNGVGEDIDLFIEVDEETFTASTSCFFFAEINPLLNAAEDPSAMRWCYFSPQEKKLEITLEILGISHDQFNAFVRPLEIHNFDIIFLPKNWRDKKVMKRLREYTDLYDRNFFKNIARDAQKIEPLISKHQLIDMRMMIIGPINELMKTARITKNDIEKFYVMNKDEKSGQIMTYEEMLTLEIVDIGGWNRIGRLDVNC